MELRTMMGNPLRIPQKEIAEARSGLEYCYRIIVYVHHLFPKGYIELKALCHYLYDQKEDVMIQRLKVARFEVDEPIVMRWNREHMRTFTNQVVFPLCTINRCASFEGLQLFEKAFDRFMTMKEDG